MKRNMLVCIVFAVIVGIIWVVILTNIRTVSNEDEIGKIVSTSEITIESINESTSKVIDINVSEFRNYCPLPLDDDAVLQEVCKENDVPYTLALGLIFTESKFNPYFVDSIGRYGYCGLSPMYFPTNLSPADNIRQGIRLLGNLIKEYNDIQVALTIYDVGYDEGDRTFANQVLDNAKEMGYTEE